MILSLVFGAFTLQPHRSGQEIFDKKGQRRVSLNLSKPTPVMASLSKQEVHKMYAIIEAGGKQYRVEEGQKLYIEKVNAEAGETVTFDRVLMVGGDNVKVGSPIVDGATVTAKVEQNGRSKKIVVYKFKPKKNYRRKQGHRQPYTQVVIDKING